MTTIAVGDIHGNLPALEDLLTSLRGGICENDTVVFLGDYIDRGPDTKGCIDAILDFQREVANQVVCLRGNHEDWLLRTLGDHRRHSWLMGMEAFDTIRSYSPQAVDLLRRAIEAAGPQIFFSREMLPYQAFFDAMPKAHISFLQSLVPYFRGPDGICVHGGLDPNGAPLDAQPLEMLLGGGDGFPEDYVGAETVAYGHWDNADLDEQRWPRPKILGATIGVDTISHGVLTAVRLSDRRVFQSSQYRSTGGLDV
jgi:serine/threonine protein phosphatase 1